MIKTHEKIRKEYLVKRPILWGIAGGSALLAIYFGVLTFANSLDHAMQQFRDMWYWIVLLVVGFGLQISLFAYVKGIAKVKSETGIATSAVAAAGGISTTSMIACCVHHVTDFIPIVGVSAAALFFTQFQTLFIVVGVLSNLIGINIMLNIIQKHKLYDKGGVISNIMKINMRKTMYVTSIFSLIVFFIVLFNSMG